MKISIFGLGYVGVVSAACFAKEGHTVIGVEPNLVKVDMINNGKTPIIEKDLGSLVSNSVSSGRLKAVVDIDETISGTDISLVCVGTPSQPNGNLDLKFIRNVSEDIGKALKEKTDYHTVIFRSTTLPGTVEGTIIPLLEKHSGKKAGVDFGVSFNPEFLRESTAVYDFYNPPKTVIGSLNLKDGEMVARLYKGIQAPLIQTSIRTAEMVKYADNVFHTLKVTFGNEIGNICKALDIDSHEVMSIFCQDTKLNLSPAYLKPGFAFGGSCLPKDLRALTYKAKSMDLDLPLLNSIFFSNQNHIRNTVNRVLEIGKKRIGILGFAFKAGTDDLRESPMVDFIETLLGKGYDLKLYDKSVNLARLIGANKNFIEMHIPHISKLMVPNIAEIVKHAEVIVIGNNSDEFINIFPELSSDQLVLDLVRIAEDIETKAQYEGICW